MPVSLELVNGFVPVGTEVDGPAELEELLSHWLTASNAPTVGEIGAFGGSPAITVKMGPDEFVLNRDTKRAAVQEFVAAAARAGGASLVRWHVTRNEKGTINRVSYRADDAPTPGWYAYLRDPFAEPRELRDTVRSRRSARSNKQPSPVGSPGQRDIGDQPGPISGAAYIVQFPHPGAEHRPRGTIMPWNPGRHGRKYMVAEATYRDERATEHLGKVVFWGEWEASSRVLQKWPKEDAFPELLHEPLLDPPPEGLRQNTDPCVFGERFYYSNCKQRTNQGQTATSMQRLTPGSLILFGSTLGGEFVLDTAFVVGRRLATLVPGEPVEVEVDDAFRVATLESLIDRATEDEKREGRTFTLYAGATPSRPVHGMFSFVPCLTHDGEGPRFARPAIRLPDMIDPRSKQSASGSNRARAVEDVVRAWDSVVSQVFREDLLLATQLHLGGRS